MKIGCSECLCIAIESHRSALLESLLQRSDVQYRDIFWAPTPPPKMWKFIEGEEYMTFPLLHDMGSDINLSIVGSDKCDHMHIDVELCSQSDIYGVEHGYILVSLPMIARWHTSESFDAEGLLRQSGKFDYSEPQFFDVQYSTKLSNALPGPLNVFSICTINFTICEYESKNNSQRVSLDSSSQVILFNEPSILPCHMANVCVYIDSKVMLFRKFYGQLSRSFYYRIYRIYSSYPSQFFEKQQKILDCGGDLNTFILSPQTWMANGDYRWGNMFRWNNCYGENCFDECVFPSWRDKFEDMVRYSYRSTPERPILQCNHNTIRDAHRLTCFLLRNGLSFFYISVLQNHEMCNFCCFCDMDKVNKSLLRSLFMYDARMPKCLLPFSRGIAQQLLALGFGRRELHPAPFTLLDEHLDDTRQVLKNNWRLWSLTTNATLRG